MIIGKVYTIQYRKSEALNRTGSRFHLYLRQLQTIQYKIVSDSVTITITTKGVSGLNLFRQSASRTLGEV